MAKQMGLVNRGTPVSFLSIGIFKWMIYDAAIDKRMIFHEQPMNFLPTMSVVGVLIESNGAILLLRRQIGKSQELTWGVPGGKVDAGETELEAAVREVQEETHLPLIESCLVGRGHFFVRYPDYDFTYTLFAYALADQPIVAISADEHSEFCWATPVASLRLPLIPDMDVCLKQVYHLD